MTTDKQRGFNTGIGVTIFVIVLIALVFSMGRGCQMIVDRMEIRLCEKEGLPCFYRVLEIEPKGEK